MFLNMNVQLEEQHMSGVLAIWNDCAAGLEDEYESWYQEEHLPERLAVPGFSLGRRYHAIDASSTFFTIYDVVSVAVLFSTPYLDRLAEPTERTRQMMANGFKNMSRTICESRSLHGGGHGGIIVTATSVGTESWESLQTLSDLFPSSAGEVRRDAWLSVEDDNQKPSEEELIRGRDRKITGGLATEFLYETDARQFADRINGLRPAMSIGIFRLISLLTPEGNI